jgi:D-alanine-D-alanine ligase-like ATP-grasp enzyme
MLKIGLVCWKQGGGTNDYVQPKKQPWLSDVTILKQGKYKGLIPFEKALQAALLYNYKDIEVSFINTFDEKKLEKNDVNFLVSLNLLAAWEKSDVEYKRVLKLMQTPSLNIYPNLQEQFFLFDKGDYLEYYKKKGIPIAPTFVVRDDRNPHTIIQRVRKEGWKSFVLKPHRAYANIGIGKFDRKHGPVNSVSSKHSSSDTVVHSSITNPQAEAQVATFLTKNKKFPAFVCQEVMDGFAKFWEVKSFWINGEFKYYVAMKAADKVFSESKIYGSNPEEFGTVSPKVLKDIKKMGKRVVDLFPTMNPRSDPPLYLRIDFGCCRDNTMDGESYFLNEIEYAGCAIFTQEGTLTLTQERLGNNIFDMWVKAYHDKAIEFTPTSPTPTRTKRPKRVKRPKRPKRSKRPKRPNRTKRK